jgi:NMD protein affecting ribosome stability and mRNA decay
VFHAGRWQWAEAPQGAHLETCPACRRIEDKCPAGFLTLSGEFLTGHREEILSLIHNVEQREKSEHALKRIMSIEDQDGGVQITFTDPQLARAAGQAVASAYQGELDFSYQDNEFLLRVSWKR